MLFIYNCVYFAIINSWKFLVFILMSISLRRRGNWEEIEFTKCIVEDKCKQKRQSCDTITNKGADRGATLR